jgi:hypothetical protein
MPSAYAHYIASRGAVFEADTEVVVPLAPTDVVGVARGQGRIVSQDQTASAGPASATGTAAVTFDPLTVSATGALTNRGAAAFTLDDLTVTATGDSDHLTAGNAAIVLDPLTVDASGHNAASAAPLTNAQMQELYLWMSELHLIHGLRAGSPLAVTQTARVAGPVAQTVGEAGGTVTVVRQ